MMRFAAKSGRSSLGFSNSAKLSFDFLVADFGFHVVDEHEPTLIRYESPEGFVNVFHSRGGYRVGAEIGRFITTAKGTRAEDRVTLFEIVSAAGDKVAAHMLDIPAESAAAVSAAVNDAARLVRLYGVGLLLGDDTAYLRIAEYRRAANERSAAEGTRLWEMRQAAHKAWERGDHVEAIRLLRQLPGLTKDETRMLGAANPSNASSERPPK